MDKMEWALWGLEYLATARNAIHSDFTAAMGEVRGYPGAHHDSWHGSCKNIISTLYHFSMEFVADTKIPCEQFASPEAFEAELASYRAFIQGMADELYQEDQKFRAKNKMGESPYLITIARRQVVRIGNAIDYVQSKKPKIPNANYVETDIDLIIRLARRFHESALSLREHPHNGTIFSIGNEWDCQYLFRALLAAYITDVRDEEWNPSVAGSSARCEFFLKTLSTMIELKYVRKSSDVRKIKSELATDFLDYGNNPQVSRVICLVYDPTHALKNPAAVQADLSGPKTGLARVDVVVSPSRD